MAASLESKVFVVTGGASGMGLSTCRILAKAGAKAISIGDYNDANFSAVREELHKINPSTEVETVKLNVSSSSEVSSWIKGVVSKFKGLDGAVNAAGVAQTLGTRKSPGILEETDEMWDRVLGINLSGIFYCCREQIRAMSDLPKGTSRSIVNIASIASLIHGGDTFSYGVSKAGNAYLTGCLAKDVLPHGIRVNAVSPGATNTPMLSQFFAPEAAGAIDTQGFGLVQPTDIAQAVVWLLSDESSQISGVNLPVGPGAP
ncbi:MAG: hypothetical protein M1818_001825 [Claussenomyces sp. TS43310]|nr:MAG: hypothetical protein M1818_001825 [Claussenomyces sp. TS43310]